MNAGSRCAAVVSAGFVGVLVLGGCGSESGAKSSASPSVKAGSASAEGTTAASSASSAASADPTPGARVDAQKLSTRLERAMSKQKFVRVTMPDPTGMGDEPMLADMLMPGAGQVEGRWSAGGHEVMRLVDGTMYLRNDEPGGPEEPKWIAVPDDSKDPEAASLALMMKSATQQSPADQTALMAKSRVSFVGRTQVGGEPSEHYRVTTSLGAVADETIKRLREVAGPGSAEERQIRKVMATQRGTSLTSHIWVAPSGLMQKTEMRAGDLALVAGEPGEQGADSDERFVVEYSRWGVPVKVAAPPHGEVGTFEEMPGE